MKLGPHHLAYCTNVHPAETWKETLQALKTHTLRVRDRIAPDQAFAIGLRLSDQASQDLMTGSTLNEFVSWMNSENLYVFTINGFPFGDFHGTRVKENVYRPDWTSPERLKYTKRLFEIIACLSPADSQGSVSTLPGSFKAFNADEFTMFTQLEELAHFIEELSITHGKDLHLGMEPEPLGHFENTEETLTFFDRFLSHCSDPDLIKRRIGINYDTCHFALEYDDCRSSLNSLIDAGLRISKIHLSNALSLNPKSDNALARLPAFNEPTYLHQVMTRSADGSIGRYPDIPEALPLADRNAEEWRIHFHIPLYSNPDAPLGSTRNHSSEALAYLKKHPECCSHLEIETYTWGVLPKDLQKPITNMIVDEYSWVQEQFLTTH